MIVSAEVARYIAVSVIVVESLPLRPGFGTYQSDAYFQPSTTGCDYQVYPLELERIHETQESLVIKYVAGGLSPVVRETLEALVTDGGQLSPKDIADRHVGSVRRALRQMPDLFDRSYGRVSLRSSHLATLVYEKVKQAQNRADRAGNSAKKATERKRDEAESALHRWVEEHGIEVTGKEGGEQLTFDLGTVESARRIIREGLQRWEEADLPPSRFRMAKVVYTKRRENISNYLDIETEPMISMIWQLLT